MISMQKKALSSAANAIASGDGRAQRAWYAQTLSRAKDIDELTVILDDIMCATQTEALHTRDELIASRQQAQIAEARIRELEATLEKMRALTKEDPLTGSLNRRGLNDVFKRELARSTRRSAPLCVAMLDLDDFKRLNDSHGHDAGDQALIHLVRVIKDTLRTMDAIARFGGEEFLIVLPDTMIDDALQVVTRLQQELNKRILMHNNQHLKITFSAGVALRNPGEDQALLIKHADAALYKAKKAGKNCVVVVE